jgi:hypothetical protein
LIHQTGASPAILQAITIPASHILDSEGIQYSQCVKTTEENCQDSGSKFRHVSTLKLSHLTRKTRAAILSKSTWAHHNSSRNLSRDRFQPNCESFTRDKNFTPT